MSHPQRPPDGNQPGRRDKPDQTAGWWGIAALVLMLVCCALPLLLLAGTLGALSAWRSNPRLIAAAALILLALLGWAWQGRRGHRNTGTGCCPPRHTRRRR